MTDQPDPIAMNHRDSSAKKQKADSGLREAGTIEPHKTKGKLIWTEWNVQEIAGYLNREIQFWMKYDEKVGCPYGRLYSDTGDGKYPNLSVGLPKYQRNMLTQNMWPADFANAHNTLAVQEAHDKQVDVTNIEIVCKDKAAFRKRVAEGYGVDPDHAKELLIRLLFGGKFTSWRNDMLNKHGITCKVPPQELKDIIRGLEKEYAQLRKKTTEGGIVTEKFYRIMTNRGGSASAEDEYEGKPDGSMLGLYLQTIECEKLQECMRIFKKDGYTLAAIVGDAFFVYKQTYNREFTYDDFKATCRKATDAINPPGETFRLKLMPEDNTPSAADRHIVDMIAQPTTTAPSAALLAELYSDRVICDEHGQWYCVPDGQFRWSSTVAQPFLKSKMQDEVCRMFKKRAPHAFFYGDHPGKQVLPYNRVQHALRTNRNQNEIVAAYATLSSQRHPRFGQQLDTNQYLIGLDNGVVELMRPGDSGSSTWKDHPEGWLFRPGTPADMISKTTGYDFEPDWATATKYRNEYTRYISKVFKGPEMEHFKLISAWILCGDNSLRRKFLLMPGHGGNSKSVLTNFLSKVLGDYFFTMDSSAIQESSIHRDDEEHSTKLSTMPGCRVAIAHEPNRGQPYNQSKIKKMTGGDTFSARPAHGRATDIVNFIPQTAVMQMMNYPDLPTYKPDPAFYKRIDVLEMKSQFGQRQDKTIITEDDDEKREYVQDANISLNMGNWKHCWLEDALAAYKGFLANPEFQFEHSTAAWETMSGMQCPVRTFLEEEVQHVTREVYNELDPALRFSRIDKYHYEMHQLYGDFQLWKKKQTKAAFLRDDTDKKKFISRVRSICGSEMVAARDTRLKQHFPCMQLYQQRCKESPFA